MSAHLREAWGALVTARYTPDPTASDKGEFIMQDGPFGPEAVGYRQSHDTLVMDALEGWKGWPSDMQIHMAYEREGAPMPDSGGGKMKRMQAAALIWEMEHKARPNNKPLYRGSHVPPGHYQEWSELRRVANNWAKKNNGKVMVLEPGQGRGLRISDYVGEDPEAGWIIDSASARYAAKTAMPSWRAQGTDFWNDFDCVIATDANGRGRNFEVYTHGKQWASRHSIADAKASVEEVYGPLTWRRIQLPTMSYDHYYFGEIGEEMTDPHSILVADLPKLGKLAMDDDLDKALEDLADAISNAPPGKPRRMLPDPSELYGGYISESSRGLLVDGKPVQKLYRVVDPGEWAEAQRNGYLQSRGGYTRASAKPDERWRYQGEAGVRGVTLEIDYHPTDNWRASAEGYAATRAKIPLSRVRVV